jgi:hypothetical protein
LLAKCASDRRSLLHQDFDHLSLLHVCKRLPGRRAARIESHDLAQKIFRFRKIAGITQPLGHSQRL